MQPKCIHEVSTLEFCVKCPLLETSFKFPEAKDAQEIDENNEIGWAAQVKIGLLNGVATLHPECGTPIHWGKNNREQAGALFCPKCLIKLK